MIEKNRIRPIHVGKGVRMSYSKQKEVLEMPNLIEVQKKSYEWFLTEGLTEAFRDISPIEDYNGKLSLEFISFSYAGMTLSITLKSVRNVMRLTRRPSRLKLDFTIKRTRM